MSKTFQEIEISNGSWIKEQSDQMNIFNEKKSIDFSEDTFRLFDAMIFISYNASPLMHALKPSKQSLNYQDYWEKSIDYIISEINLKEYNNISKEGIESFVLFWKIIAEKNVCSNEFRNHLIAELINTIYDSVIDLNYDFPNDLNILNLSEVNYSNLIENPKKENILKYRFSNSDYKITNSAKRYIITKTNFYNSLLYIKHLKQNYKDWFKRELRNWLKANLVLVKIFGNRIEKFPINYILENKIFNEVNKITTKSTYLFSYYSINILGMKCSSIEQLRNILNFDEDSFTYENFNLDKVNTKFSTLYNNSNKFESTLNIVLLDKYKNNLENKCKIYILKIILISFLISIKRTQKIFLKIKKLHEKITCAKLSVVSEYIFITFIAQVLKKL